MGLDGPGVVTGRDQMARAVRALRPYLSAPGCFPTRAALEAVRNAACVEGFPIREILVHRMATYGLRVGDLESAVKAAREAWGRG